LNPDNKNLLVLTCEHGGCEVPERYLNLFAGHQALLESHRGWDRGALELATRMSQQFDVPLHASTTTRLLIDLNRSPGHRQLFSELTRPLPAAVRRDIVRDHYRPYRDTIESTIATHIARGHRVIHIASHSFTPVMQGVVRRADVACLYDPARSSEAALAAVWLKALASLQPGLSLRRNYPYQGRADGLMSVLRKRFSNAFYLGVELEVNQYCVTQAGAAWQAVQSAVVASLALATRAGNPEFALG
jgi:predicted N-formylglutamate amidohydrolase